MSRKPLLIIFITVFVDLLGFGIVAPLLPRYAEHFLPDQMQNEISNAGSVAAGTETNVTAATGHELIPLHKYSPKAGLILGCLMASFSAMQFLFAPLWGMVSDRVGRRPILLIGLAGSTIFYSLFALVTQWGNSGDILGISPLVWLFITRIGAGISGATIPTAQAYIADCTDEKTRGKGMAIIGAAFGIGFTFGPILGSFFVPSSLSSVPSAAPGYVASGLSGLAFLFGLTWLPESLKRDREFRTASHGWMRLGPTIRVLSNRTLGRIALAIFITTFAFAQFETTLATLTLRIGVSDRDNFYVFAYIGFILTLAQGLLVRRLIPKLGEFRMAVAGVVLMTVGLLLIAQVALKSQSVAVASAEAVANDAAPMNHTFWWLVIVLPVSVVGFASTTPALQSMLSLNTDEGQQGEVLGVGQSLSALARIAGPVVGLSLQQRNLAYPYVFGGLLMALGIVMVVRLRRVLKTKMSDPAKVSMAH